MLDGANCIAPLRMFSLLPQMRFDAYQNCDNGQVMTRTRENAVLHVLRLCKEDDEPKTEEKSHMFPTCVQVKGRIINCGRLISNNSSGIDPLV